MQVNSVLPSPYRTAIFFLVILPYFTQICGSVQSLSDELTDNQSTDSSEEDMKTQMPSPFPQSISTMYPGFMNQSPQSTEAPQYVYPEGQESLSSTGTSTERGPQDSQVTQPEFSSEQADSNNVENDQRNSPDFGQSVEVNPTNEPIGDTTLPENDETSPADFENGTELSDQEVDPNEWTPEDNDSDIPEQLPTPEAIISPNGEGSNPSIEEEFAEAFNRVGPKPKRRRVRPFSSSGSVRKRVRMRVRKGERNLTEGPFETEATTLPTVDYTEAETTTTESTSVRPRRYRSTTASPPEANTIPQSVTTGVSVIKNGPKPLIISDIHSGSTGINPVTVEPQVEKPTVGAFTEKISTYFITPPTRISTTEQPKVNSSSSEDSKPGESVIHIKSSVWDRGNVMKTELPPQNSTASSFTFTIPTTTETESSTVAGNPGSEGSLEPPNMQNRAYTMDDHESVRESDYDNRGYLTPASPTQQTEDSHPNYPGNYEGDEPKSNVDPSEIQFLPQQSPGGYPEPHFNEYEPTQSYPTGPQPEFSSGSHYDRNKDPFFNGNNFFKQASSAFQNSNGANSPVTHGSYEHQLNSNPSVQGSQEPLPVFDQSGYRVDQPTVQPLNYYPESTQGGAPEEYSNNLNAISNQDFNDYGKQTHYAPESFQGSPVDPRDAAVTSGYPYSSGPESVNLVGGYGFQGNNQPSASPDLPSNVDYSGNPETGPPQYVPQISGDSQSEISDPNAVQHSPDIPSSSIYMTHEHSDGQQDGQSGGQSGGAPLENSFGPPHLQQHLPQNTNYGPNQGPGGQMVATIENVPVHELQSNAVVGHSHGGNDENQRFPVFIATSPGDHVRSPQFIPAVGGKPPNYRHSSFLRYHVPFNGPHPHGQHSPPQPHHTLPRYMPMPSYRPQHPMFSPMSQNHGPGPNFHHHQQGPPARPPPDFRNAPSDFRNAPSDFRNAPSDFRNAPSDFRNPQSFANIPPPGLQHHQIPPSEAQGMSGILSNSPFPPHAHLMFDKPDYEPANPPLPPGHPLENHVETFSDISSNHGESSSPNVESSPHVDDFKLPDVEVVTHTIEISNDQTSPDLRHPPHPENTGPSPPNNSPGYDIVSAYYDKPPPTVGYLANAESQDLVKRPVKDIKDNSLGNVPYQYTSSDGGGLDGGPYFHPSGPEAEDNNNDEHKNSYKPPYSGKPNSGLEHAETTEKNKTSVYSNTPYVLMFPQLVPEEAMMPLPPKMLTKEINVVQASSLSSMTFTPEGKPALGPGLKTVPVHPRHQMYQVLAKAHYDKTLQKYMEARKKPPSAIYTPYGVLVPMGPSASASTNRETFANGGQEFSPFGHNPKKPDEKHLINLLLGSNTPLGQYRLHKAAGYKNGRLTKHLDFKANVDPALDLLAEKLAIKLGAAKYLLSAPAKLGVHAFAKHHGSHSEPVPVIAELKSPKPKGEVETSNTKLVLEQLLSQSSNIINTKVEANNTKPDPTVKAQLKAILKERLREIMEEAESVPQMDKPISSRTGRMMHGLNKMSHAHSPSTYGKLVNYFSHSNHHNSNGGLLGTIKRLFSFRGGNNGNDRDSFNDDFGGFATSSNVQQTFVMANSSHPFDSYKSNKNFNPLRSLGIARIGPAQSQKTSARETSSVSNPASNVVTWKPEKKTKKQLEKWLDIILKSSDSSSKSLNGKKPQKPLSAASLLSTSSFLKDTSNLRQGKALDLDTSASSSSISVIKVVPPIKSKLTSSLSSHGEYIAKAFGEKKSNSQSNSNTFFYSSWKPMISAFRSAFTYPASKSAIEIKSKASIM